MDISHLISVAAQNPALVKQLASQFGISDQQTQQITNMAMLALGSGFQKNIEQSNGLESLVNALNKGDHTKFVEDPSSLQNATNEGNGILGHVFGSKDVSRGVAAKVGAQTGISNEIIKQMLPVLASMAMGALSKNMQQNGQSDFMMMMTALLDRNKNGTAIDEIIQMVVNSQRR